MSDIVRTFRIPMDLEARQRRALEDGCGALQARQHAFSTAAPAAVAAHDVTLEGPILRLRYRVEGVQPVVDVRHTADSEAIHEWTRQIAVAMSAAYPRGQAAVLKHGCLSRDNIVLDAWGAVRILDFGISECITAALEPADEFWIRQSAATTAPELWTNPSAWGQQSDVFAIGVLLYELATGAHPYGARPENPDDCKFRILTELALAPHARGVDIDPHLSRIIHTMVRRETHERYTAFADVLDDLEARPAAAAPSATDTAASPVVEPAATGDAGQADDARQRYLEEQAQLRSQREESERRQSHKRQQRQAKLAALRTTVRKHAVLLSVAAVACCVVLAATVLFGIRSRNHGIVSRELQRVAEELDARFRGGDGQLAALILNLQPSRALATAFEDLHKTVPDGTASFDEPGYADFFLSRGEVLLRLGQAEFGVPFQLSDAAPGGVDLRIDPQRLAATLIDTSEQLALQQLPRGAHELARTLRASFSAAGTVAGLQSALTAHLQAPQPQALNYLAVYGERAAIALGAFKPIAGETGLRADATLTTLDGEDILEEPAELRFSLELDAADNWTIRAVHIDPKEEPQAHMLWCMKMTLQDIRAAFDARDAARLAALTHPADEPEIERMLDWVQRCPRASLVEAALQVSSGTAEVMVQFDPGIPGAPPLHSAAMALQLDRRDGWRVRHDRPCAWPAAPAALLRSEIGARFVEGFRTAWQDRDAVAYLQHFDGHRRSTEAVRAMFIQMESDGVQYDIAPEVDSNDNARLLIHVRPQVTPQVARTGHVSKTFGFEITNDGPRWDRGEDPLWVFAGKHFETLARRLRAARWHGVAEIEHDFNRTAAQDMSSLERNKIERWIEAIQHARRLFEPLSETYVAGFPQRVGLREDAERLTFQLVPMVDQEPSVLYVQEREFRREDLGDWWTGPGKTPGRWAQLVGDPPDGQVVGISFDDAGKIARHLGCALPTATEWRAAAAALSDSPSQPGPHAFHGGVWEFCAAEAQAATDAAPLVLGGSWYDYDPELREAGVPPPAERRLQARQQRFGTVGFRLCQRFAVPPEALMAAESAGAP